MNYLVYDCEVFKYDWLVTFKNVETGVYTRIWNDNNALRDCISSDNIYIGFNNKHYDQFIIKGICAGLSAPEIKQINDFIIVDGNQGWDFPALKGSYLKGFYNVDLKDDMQLGNSLKSIEGHLGMNIEETSVDFDIDRPLTKGEKRRTEHYCDHDVDTTHKLLVLRKDYLRTKYNLGVRAGVDPIKALTSTNAKLTALMLHAERKEWNDGRDYVYPKEVDLTAIPTEVIDFFEQIHDLTIDDDTLFEKKLKIEIGEMPCTYAWGGVHGSLTGYHEKAAGTRIIQNRDVSSLYPSLIEQYNYLSRNVPDPKLYIDIKHDRIQAKHNGDKQLAKDLKLPLNTVSGAQENRFNDLYDPLPTRSLRISGQLFLTMLTTRLISECQTIRLLNLNTDGLMYSIDESELPIVDRICAEWEKETRFELETDEISEVWIKDVNNLIFLNTDGDVKSVGGYLKYGISNKGAWTVNNSMPIVKKAMIEYYVHKTPVEDTINSCTDIFDFQIIAKSGQTYSSTYHIVDDVQIPVQKVNRVYATANERYGKLYKVRADNGRVSKIASLPEHCIIDNTNKLTIADVDKQFYIDVTNKCIDDFAGIKPAKKTGGHKEKMATAKSTTTKAKENLNVYQKLNKARLEFLKAGAKKTGKNMHLSFKYFELDDIVPVATPIFDELGLALIMGNFTQNTATASVINTDEPDEVIEFSAPFNQIEPIISNAGKQATNSMQAEGSSITYMRRYLYMLVLDICESDEFDKTIGAPIAATPIGTDAPKPVALPTIPQNSKIPATPEERKEVKAELTAPSDNASELQIKGLKNVLKKLIESDPSKQETAAAIAVQTNGFTTISKTDCEALTTQITAILNGSQEETK